MKLLAEEIAENMKLFLNWSQKIIKFYNALNYERFQYFL